MMYIEGKENSFPDLQVSFHIGITKILQNISHIAEFFWVSTLFVDWS